MSSIYINYWYFFLASLKKKSETAQAAFESAYEILNGLDSDDGLEYVNRLVDVRNNITLRSNDMLRLMRTCLRRKLYFRL